MVQLSPNFSLVEMTRSNTAARRGLDNTPPRVTLEVLRQTAKKMELVRTICGNRAITVFSGYRSPDVNAAVGGSANSDHVRGLAVDFIVKGLTVAETVEMIRESDLEFDQLIDEFSGWVHIGFGTRNRRQVLKARRIGGRTVYNVTE